MIRVTGSNSRGNLNPPNPAQHQPAQAPHIHFPPNAEFAVLPTTVLPPGVEHPNFQAALNQIAEIAQQPFTTTLPPDLHEQLQAIVHGANLFVPEQHPESSGS